MPKFFLCKAWTHCLQSWKANNNFGELSKTDKKENVNR